MKTVSIVLISMIDNPKYGNSGIDFIASYLRQQDGIIVDTKYYHHGESYYDVLNDISKTYDIYCFSVYSTNYSAMRKIARIIKKKQSNAVTVFGGQFISMNYKEIVGDALEIDYFILGDGEETLLRLICMLSKYNFLCNDFFDDNIATKTDYDGKELWINNDIERWPAFDYYINDDIESNKLKVHCLFTKNNFCTGACTFCCSQKGKIIYRSIESITKEISYVATSFGVRNFYFCDDNIFDVDNEETKTRLMDLFYHIKKLKLNLVFSAFAKATSIRWENIELYKLMAQIGFYYFFIGVDAGNEQDRVLYNKKATLEDNVRAIEILKNVGIWPRYGLILLNPYSTVERLKESYYYLLKLKSSNFYHYGGLSLQVLYGTKMYDKTKEDGMLKNDYSFLNVYGYKYADNKVQEIVEFMKNEFMPLVDNVPIQFTQMKRIFEMTRHINKEANVFLSEIERYEKEECEHIQEFFFHLYVENDLEYCRKNVGSYINKMLEMVPRFEKIIKKMENIYIHTPLG